MFPMKNVSQRKLQYCTVIQVKELSSKEPDYPKAIYGTLNDGASLALHGGQHTTLHHSATRPLPRDFNSLQQHQAGLLHSPMKLIM